MALQTVLIESDIGPISLLSLSELTVRERNDYTIERNFTSSEFRALSNRQYNCLR